MPDVLPWSSWLTQQSVNTTAKRIEILKRAQRLVSTTGWVAPVLDKADDAMSLMSPAMQKDTDFDAHVSQAAQSDVTAAALLDRMTAILGNATKLVLQKVLATNPTESNTNTSQYLQISVCEAAMSTSAKEMDSLVSGGGGAAGDVAAAGVASNASVRSLLHDMQRSASDVQIGGETGFYIENVDETVAHSEKPRFFRRRWGSLKYKAYSGYEMYSLVDEIYERREEAKDACILNDFEAWRAYFKNDAAEFQMDGSHPMRSTLDKLYELQKASADGKRNAFNALQISPARIRASLARKNGTLPVLDIYVRLVPPPESNQAPPQLWIMVAAQEDEGEEGISKRTWAALFSMVRVDWMLTAHGVKPLDAARLSGHVHNHADENDGKPMILTMEEQVRVFVQQMGSDAASDVFTLRIDLTDNITKITEFQKMSQAAHGKRLYRALSTLTSDFIDVSFKSALFRNGENDTEDKEDAVVRIRVDADECLHRYDVAMCDSPLGTLIDYADQEAALDLLSSHRPHEVPPSIILPFAQRGSALMPSNRDVQIGNDKPSDKEMAFDMYARQWAQARLYALDDRVVFKTLKKILQTATNINEKCRHWFRQEELSKGRARASVPKKDMTEFRKLTDDLVTRLLCEDLATEFVAAGSKAYGFSSCSRPREAVPLAALLSALGECATNQVAIRKDGYIHMDRCQWYMFDLWLGVLHRALGLVDHVDELPSTVAEVSPTGTTPLASTKALIGENFRALIFFPSNDYVNGVARNQSLDSVVEDDPSLQAWAQESKANERIVRSIRKAQVVAAHLNNPSDFDGRSIAYSCIGDAIAAQQLMTNQIGLSWHAWADEVDKSYNGLTALRTGLGRLLSAALVEKDVAMRAQGELDPEKSLAELALTAQGTSDDMLRHGSFFHAHERLALGSDELMSKSAKVQCAAAVLRGQELFLASCTLRMLINASQRGAVGISTVTSPIDAVQAPDVAASHREWLSDATLACCIRANRFAIDALHAARQILPPPASAPSLEMESSLLDVDNAIRTCGTASAEVRSLVKSKAEQHQEDPGVRYEPWVRLRFYHNKIAPKEALPIKCDETIHHFYVEVIGREHPKWTDTPTALDYWGMVELASSDMPDSHLLLKAATETGFGGFVPDKYDDDSDTPAISIKSIEGTSKTLCMVATQVCAKLFEHLKTHTHSVTPTPAVGLFDNGQEEIGNLSIGLNPGDSVGENPITLLVLRTTAAKVCGIEPVDKRTFATLGGRGRAGAGANQDTSKPPPAPASAAAKGPILQEPTLGINLEAQKTLREAFEKACMQEDRECFKEEATAIFAKQENSNQRQLAGQSIVASVLLESAVVSQDPMLNLPGRVKTCDKLGTFFDTIQNSDPDDVMTQFLERVDHITVCQKLPGWAHTTETVMMLTNVSMKDEQTAGGISTRYNVNDILDTLYGDQAGNQAGNQAGDEPRNVTGWLQWFRGKQENRGQHENDLPPAANLVRVGSKDELTTAATEWVRKYHAYTMVYSVGNLALEALQHAALAYCVEGNSEDFRWPASVVSVIVVHLVRIASLFVQYFVWTQPATQKLQLTTMALLRAARTQTDVSNDQGLLNFVQQNEELRDLTMRQMKAALAILVCSCKKENYLREMNTDFGTEDSKMCEVKQLFPGMDAMHAARDLSGCFVDSATASASLATMFASAGAAVLIATKSADRILMTLHGNLDTLAASGSSAPGSGFWAKLNNQTQYPSQGAQYAAHQLGGPAEISSDWSIFEHELVCACVVSVLLALKQYTSILRLENTSRKEQGVGSWLYTWIEPPVRFVAGHAAVLSLLGAATMSMQDRVVADPDTQEMMDKKRYILNTANVLLNNGGLNAANANVINTLSRVTSCAGVGVLVATELRHVAMTVGKAADAPDRKNFVPALCKVADLMLLLTRNPNSGGIARFFVARLFSKTLFDEAINDENLFLTKIEEEQTEAGKGKQAAASGKHKGDAWKGAFVQTAAMFAMSFLDELLEASKTSQKQFGSAVASASSSFGEFVPSHDDFSSDEGRRKILTFAVGAIVGSQLVRKLAQKASRDIDAATKNLSIFQLGALAVASVSTAATVCVTAVAPLLQRAQDRIQLEYLKLSAVASLPNENLVIEGLQRVSNDSDAAYLKDLQSVHGIAANSLRWGSVLAQLGRAEQVDAAAVSFADAYWPSSISTTFDERTRMLRPLLSLFAPVASFAVSSATSYAVFQFAHLMVPSRDTVAAAAAGSLLSLPTSVVAWGDEFLGQPARQVLVLGATGWALNESLKFATRMASKLIEGRVPSQAINLAKLFAEVVWQVGGAVAVRAAGLSNSGETDKAASVSLLAASAALGEMYRLQSAAISYLKDLFSSTSASFGIDVESTRSFYRTLSVLGDVLKFAMSGKVALGVAYAALSGNQPLDSAPPSTLWSALNGATPMTNLPKHPSNPPIGKPWGHMQEFENVLGMGTSSSSESPGTEDFVPIHLFATRSIVNYLREKTTNMNGRDMSHLVEFSIKAFAGQRRMVNRAQRADVGLSTTSPLDMRLRIDPPIPAKLSLPVQLAYDRFIPRMNASTAQEAQESSISARRRSLVPVGVQPSPITDQLQNLNQWKIQFEDDAGGQAVATQDVRTVSLKRADVISTDVEPNQDAARIVLDATSKLAIDAAANLVPSDVATAAAMTDASVRTTGKDFFGQNYINAVANAKADSDFNVQCHFPQTSIGVQGMTDNEIEVLLGHFKSLGFVAQEKDNNENIKVHCIFCACHGRAAPSDVSEPLRPLFVDVENEGLPQGLKDRKQLSYEVYEEAHRRAAQCYKSQQVVLNDLRELWNSAFPNDFFQEDKLVFLRALCIATSAMLAQKGLEFKDVKRPDVGHVTSQMVDERTTDILNAWASVITNAPLLPCMLRGAPTSGIKAVLGDGISVTPTPSQLLLLSKSAVAEVDDALGTFVTVAADGTRILAPAHRKTLCAFVNSMCSKVDTSDNALVLVTSGQLYHPTALVMKLTHVLGVLVLLSANDHRMIDVEFERQTAIKHPLYRLGNVDERYNTALQWVQKAIKEQEAATGFVKIKIGAGKNIVKEINSNVATPSSSTDHTYPLVMSSFGAARDVLVMNTLETNFDTQNNQRKHASLRAHTLRRVCEGVHGKSMANDRVGMLRFNVPTKDVLAARSNRTLYAATERDGARNWLITETQYEKTSMSCATAVGDVFGSTPLLDKTVAAAIRESTLARVVIEGASDQVPAGADLSARVNSVLTAPVLSENAVTSWNTAGSVDLVSGAVRASTSAAAGNALLMAMRLVQKRAVSAGGALLQTTSYHLGGLLDENTNELSEGSDLTEALVEALAYVALLAPQIVFQVPITGQGQSVSALDTDRLAQFYSGGVVDVAVASLVHVISSIVLKKSVSTVYSFDRVESHLISVANSVRTQAIRPLSFAAYRFAENKVTKSISNVFRYVLYPLVRFGPVLPVLVGVPSAYFASQAGYDLPVLKSLATSAIGLQVGVEKVLYPVIVSNRSMILKLASEQADASQPFLKTMGQIGLVRTITETMLTGGLMKMIKEGLSYAMYNTAVNYTTQMSSIYGRFSLDQSNRVAAHFKLDWSAGFASTVGSDEPGDALPALFSLLAGTPTRRQRAILNQEVLERAPSSWFPYTSSSLGSCLLSPALFAEAILDDVSTLATRGARGAFETIVEYAEASYPTTRSVMTKSADAVPPNIAREVASYNLMLPPAKPLTEVLPLDRIPQYLMWASERSYVGDTSETLAKRLSWIYNTARLFGEDTVPSEFAIPPTVRVDLETMLDKWPSQPPESERGGWQPANVLATSMAIHFFTHATSPYATALSEYNRATLISQLLVADPLVAQNIQDNKLLKTWKEYNALAPREGFPTVQLPASRSAQSASQTNAWFIKILREKGQSNGALVNTPFALDDILQNNELFFATARFVWRHVNRGDKSSSDASKLRQLLRSQKNLVAEELRSMQGQKKSVLQQVRKDFEQSFAQISKWDLLLKARRLYFREVLSPMLRENGYDALIPIYADACGCDVDGTPLARRVVPFLPSKVWKSLQYQHTGFSWSTRFLDGKSPAAIAVENIFKDTGELSSETRTAITHGVLALYRITGRDEVLTPLQKTPGDKFKAYGSDPQLQTAKQEAIQALIKGRSGTGETKFVDLITHGEKNQPELRGPVHVADDQVSVDLPWLFSVLGQSMDQTDVTQPTVSSEPSSLSTIQDRLLEGSTSFLKRTGLLERTGLDGEAPLLDLWSDAGEWVVTEKRDLLTAAIGAIALALTVPRSLLFKIVTHPSSRAVAPIAVGAIVKQYELSDSSATIALASYAAVHLGSRVLSYAPSMQANYDFETYTKSMLRNVATPNVPSVAALVQQTVFPSYPYALPAFAVIGMMWWNAVLAHLTKENTLPYHLELKQYVESISGLLLFESKNQRTRGIYESPDDLQDACIKHKDIYYESVRWQQTALFIDAELSKCNGVVVTPSLTSQKERNVLLNDFKKATVLFVTSNSADPAAAAAAAVNTAPGLSTEHKTAVSLNREISRLPDDLDVMHALARTHVSPRGRSTTFTDAILRIGSAAITSNAFTNPSGSFTWVMGIPVFGAAVGFGKRFLYDSARLRGFRDLEYTEQKNDSQPNTKLDKELSRLLFVNTQSTQLYKATGQQNGGLHFLNSVTNKMYVGAPLRRALAGVERISSCNLRLELARKASPHASSSLHTGFDDQVEWNPLVEDKRNPHLRKLPLPEKQYRNMDYLRCVQARRLSRGTEGEYQTWLRRIETALIVRQIAEAVQFPLNDIGAQQTTYEVQIDIVKEKVREWFDALIAQTKRSTQQLDVLPAMYQNIVVMAAAVAGHMIAIDDEAVKALPGGHTNFEAVLKKYLHINPHRPETRWESYRRWAGLFSTHSTPLVAFIPDTADTTISSLVEIGTSARSAVLTSAPTRARRRRQDVLPIGTNLKGDAQMQKDGQVNAIANAVFMTLWYAKVTVAGTPIAAPPSNENLVPMVRSLYHVGTGSVLLADRM